MTIDYIRVLEKLIPGADGQDVLRLRTGTIEAINSDGTVDVAISGVTVEDIPVLGSNIGLIEDQACQVLTYRGSLLVLGQVGSGAAGPVVKPYAYMTFGATSMTDNTIITLTPATVPYNDGAMYPGSGSLFTIPAGQGGVYEVGIVLRYSTQAVTANTRQARIYINGSEYMSFNTPGVTNFNNTNVIVNGSMPIPLAAGATVQFRGFQNSGAAPALTLTGNSVAWIERKR
jgi:hypothetical protein